jgi:hypothetical protein
MSAKGFSHGGVIVSGTPEERVKRVLRRRNATLTQIAEASGLAALIASGPPQGVAGRLQHRVADN